jgi:hypothetical protein
MTTTVTPYRSTVQPGRDGFAQLLRAEWTKFRSVGRWWLTLLAGVVVTLAVSLMSAFGSVTDVLDQPTRPGPDSPPVHDSFSFAHQPLTGDGALTARVTDLTGHQGDISPWAKGGIMIKESATPGTSYAAVMLTPGHGVRMQSDFTRDIAGSGAGLDAPRWLRLTRSGDEFTGYESADGENWRTIGTMRVPGLPGTAEAGLFVAAPDVVRTERQFGSTSVGGFPGRATAVFDEVTLTDGRAEDWQHSAVGERPPVGGVPEEDGGLEQAGDSFTLTGSGDVAPRVLDSDLARISLSGAQIGLIAFAALGVLFITAEYRRGMIRTTLTASPRRGRVLAAKAVVLGTVTFAAGLVASVISFLVGQPALRENGHRPPAFPELALSDGPVLRAVLGTAALLALVAVFALALGALLRHTAAAVSIVIVLLVLPMILATGLPLGAAHALLSATPAAGFNIQHTVTRYDHVDSVCLPEDGCTPMGPGGGLAVLCAYAAVALGLAVWRLRRQDA